MRLNTKTKKGKKVFKVDSGMKDLKTSSLKGLTTKKSKKVKIR